jgi:hypothetical protein
MGGTLSCILPKQYMDITSSPSDAANFTPWHKAPAPTAEWVPEAAWMQMSEAQCLPLQRTENQFSCHPANSLPSTVIMPPHPTSNKIWGTQIFHLWMKHTVHLNYFIFSLTILHISEPCHLLQMLFCHTFSEIQDHVLWWVWRGADTCYWPQVNYWDKHQCNAAINKDPVFK